MKEIDTGELKEWLSRQDVYTLHHLVRRKFKQPMVIAFSENYQWDMDSANMNKYKEFNEGYFLYSLIFYKNFIYIPYEKI